MKSVYEFKEGEVYYNGNGDKSIKVLSRYIKRGDYGEYPCVKILMDTGEEKECNIYSIDYGFMCESIKVNVGGSKVIYFYAI